MVDCQEVLFHKPFFFYNIKINYFFHSGTQSDAPGLLLSPRQPAHAAAAGLYISFI